MKKEKFRDKISKYIKKQNEKSFKRMQKENLCVHKWSEYGYGFKCSRCNYYTGTNDVLNNFISRSK